MNNKFKYKIQQGGAWSGSHLQPPWDRRAESARGGGQETWPRFPGSESWVVSRLQQVQARKPTCGIFVYAGLVGLFCRCLQSSLPHGRPGSSTGGAASLGERMFMAVTPGGSGGAKQLGQEQGGAQTEEGTAACRGGEAAGILRAGVAPSAAASLVRMGGCGLRRVGRCAPQALCN